MIATFRPCSRALAMAFRAEPPVVTTGGSALKAIARAREHGLKVAIILGLVDREEGGRETLEKEAPLVSLFRRGDFVG